MAIHAYTYACGCTGSARLSGPRKSREKEVTRLERRKCDPCYWRDEAAKANLESAEAGLEAHGTEEPLIAALAVTDRSRFLDILRFRRGDPNLMPFIFDAPISLNADQSMAAGMRELRSEHLMASIYPRSGRWVFATGIGSLKREHGMVTDALQAYLLAQATLMSAWLLEVTDIMKARKGDLSWGRPIPFPGSVQVLAGEPD